MKLNEKNYIERDESWMYFNHRILEEAQREDIPLMERLNFPTTWMSFTASAWLRSTVS